MKVSPDFGKLPSDSQRVLTASPLQLDSPPASPAVGIQLAARHGS